MATGTCNVSTQDNSSDVVGECVVTRLCEPCVRNKSSKTARVFCKDCNELFCDQCSHLHTVYIPGKHEMVNIQDMDSVPVVVDMKGMDTCQEHKEPIKFFCEDHSKLCCSTCAFIHRKCEHVDEIVSVAGEKRADLHALKQSLLKMESDADSIIADCKKSVNNLNESIANISKQVDEMKERIIQLFDETKQKMLTEANAVKCEEVKRLGDRSEASTKVKEEINQVVPMCSTILEHGTPQQMFILSKMIDEKHKTMASNINAQQQALEVSLSFPRELSALLEMGNNFIKLNCVRNKTADPSSDGSSSLSRPVTLELLLSVDLPKTGDDEKEPLLTGLDFLCDGRLVAVDNYNMKCIILNDRLQRLGTPYKFKTHPCDVVCVSQSEIAVTVYTKTVCLLSVSPDNVISLTRKINTSSNFFSICCKTPSNMVVSTYSDPVPARMISVDGVESDFDHVVFPNKTYKLDESLCTYIQSRNTLVLTDRLAHTVYMYDTVNGTSRAVTDENIQDPRGVCVGPGDTVLVCSGNKNSIVHLTVDGEILGTYPVDMIHPRAQCMSKDGTRLGVTNAALDTRKLQLFKISPAPDDDDDDDEDEDEDDDDNDDDDDDNICGDYDNNADVDDDDFD